VAALLPKESAPPAARDLLRRWVLRPPPPRVADRMQELLRVLVGDQLRVGLPPLQHRLCVAELARRVESREANAKVFWQLSAALTSALRVLGDEPALADGLAEPLVALVAHDRGRCGLERGGLHQVRKTPRWPLSWTNFSLF
jgi:hypothetical protein